MFSENPIYDVESYNGKENNDAICEFDIQVSVIWCNENILN